MYKADLEDEFYCIAFKLENLYKLGNTKNMEMADILMLCDNAFKMENQNTISYSEFEKHYEIFKRIITIYKFYPKYENPDYYYLISFILAKRLFSYQVMYNSSSEYQQYFELMTSLNMYIHDSINFLGCKNSRTN